MAHESQSSSNTKLDLNVEQKQHIKDNMTETCTARKTILFVPLDCVGHVNSLVSIADCLRQFGHRTVFLFYDPMDGGLSARGHEVYDCTTSDGLQPSTPSEKSEAKWTSIVEAMGKLWRSSLIDNFTETTRVGLGSMMRDVMAKDDIVARKLELIKPNLIIIDHYFMQPALIKYGCPWARVYSASPLALHPSSARLPPATLGLPTKWLDCRDQKQLAEYKSMQETVRQVSGELREQFNDFLVNKHNLEPLPSDPISYIYTSKWLNVYMYPKELDYSIESNDGQVCLSDWQQCDSLLRINSVLPSRQSVSSSSSDKTQQTSAIVSDKPVSNFELPREFEQKSGKLIFLSMGSLASGDVALMKRLVAILAKCPHKFIVSRGSNWQQYELAHNMWGEKFVPQLEVLQKIDLIITHGGNNTITECFYYGVPGFVVCPVFSDQYDNAQRIEEQNLGKRVDPFHCTDEQLLSAIESVLNDDSIPKRMAVIKERMQLDENKYKAIRLFKDFVDSL